jgi:hypothetical protein
MGMVELAFAAARVAPSSCAVAGSLPMYSISVVQGLFASLLEVLRLVKTTIDLKPDVSAWMCLMIILIVLR